jgi:hypothetical protein
MAVNLSRRGAIVEMPKFNRRDLDHSKLSSFHTYRNGPADAQFQMSKFGLNTKIRFADIASHKLADASSSTASGSDRVPGARAGDVGRRDANRPMTGAASDVCAGSSDECAVIH